MNNKIIKYIFVLCITLIIYSCNNEFSKKGYNTLNLSKSLIYKNPDGTKVKLNSPEYINGEVTPIEDKDSLFLISASGGIVKMSLENKKVLWKKKIASIPQKNLSFDNGHIYFTSIDNKFYILNYETGETEFIYYTYSTKRTLMNSVKPIIYKNAIIVVFGNGEIVVFDKKSKKVLKKLNEKEIIDDSVILENGILKINNKNALDINKLLRNK